MDPNLLLSELLDSLADMSKHRNFNERENAILALENLAEWLKKEGFSPDIEYVGKADIGGGNLYRVPKTFF